jgi:hypothetical protein
MFELSGWIIEIFVRLITDISLIVIVKEVLKF